MPDTTENPIDPATADMVRRKARQIARRLRTPAADSDDFAQDLGVELLKRLPHYNPARQNRDAFIRMVLRRATVGILRHFLAAKRDDRTLVSLDALLDRDKMDETKLACPNSEVDQALLERELADRVARLPPKLRDLLERLQTLTIAEAARHMGVPRSTLMDRVRELRRRLETPNE